MRIPITSAALSAICLALTASCATAVPDQPSRTARGDQCFNPRSATTFRPVGRDAVDVQISRNRVYRLSLGTGCFDIDWAQAVALRSRSGSFVCSASDAELIVPSTIGPDRCQVTDIRRLTEAEIRARPSR